MYEVNVVHKINVVIFQNKGRKLLVKITLR